MTVGGPSPANGSSQTAALAEFAAGGAFVDGHIVPISDAGIPILDTGFSRSDVTYDVVGLWDGAFFRLDDHLARFERSCRELRLSLRYDLCEIAEILMDLIRVSGLRDAYVETICTRGEADGSRDPRNYTNQFYAFAIPYVWIFRPADECTGMDAIVAKTVRRIPSEAIDPTVKNFHWGDLTKGLYEAYDRNAHYPILLDHAGFVTEGPGYNIFAFVNQCLLTPAAGALEGITRKTVLELARQEGLCTRTAQLTERELHEAPELFATSTAGGVMPITSLDGRPVGNGKVGDVTALLRERYWSAHKDPRYATPVDYGTAGQWSLVPMPLQPRWSARRVAS